MKLLAAINEDPQLVDRASALLNQALPIFNEALPLWKAGGWAMIPLAFNALLLCGKAVEVRFALQGKGYMNRRWAAAIKRKSPTRRTPPELERAAQAARDYLDAHKVRLPPNPNPDDVLNAFQEVRSDEMPPIDRDLRFLKVAMSAAPLWGLLGTVSGMLSTFAGLASGGGGDKTMDNVASGISEALITTQTGLMVALPGYFFHYYLTQHRSRFDAFLAQLETALTQLVFQKGSATTSGHEPTDVSQEPAPREELTPASI